MDDTLPIGVSLSSLKAGSLVFDDYVVETLIQADEAGERYVAHHRLTGQLVTLLLLAADLGRDEEMRRLILSEGRRLARLHHPNIPVMFNLREDQGRFLAVFEHPEGTVLEHILARQGALSAARVSVLAEQLLSALDEAHRNGLVHGALSPKWVVVDGRDQLTVMGFGFLQSLQARRPGRRSDADPRYQAPEQALGRPVDERTDVYLAGLVLYAMLAGRPPFDGPADYEILRGQVEQPPPDLRALQPTVPPATALVVGRALVKSPDGRYDSAASFLHALRQAGRDSIQERLILPAARQPLATDRGLPSAGPTPSGVQGGERGRRVTVGEVPSVRMAEKAVVAGVGAALVSGEALAPQAPPLAPGIARATQDSGRRMAPDLSVEPDESWDKSDDEPAGPGSAALAQPAPVGASGGDDVGRVARDQAAGAQGGARAEGRGGTVESATSKGTNAQAGPLEKEEQGPNDKDVEGPESAASTVPANSSTSGFGSFFNATESYGGDDDFSDLEDLTGGRRGVRRWWVVLGVLLMFGGGGLGAYYYFDPYARVSADEDEEERPADQGTDQGTDQAAMGADEKSDTASSVPSRQRPGTTPGRTEPRPRPEVTSPPPSLDPPEAELFKVRAVWKKSKARAIAPLEKLLGRFPESAKVKQMLGSAYEERAWRQLNDGLYRRTIVAAKKSLALWPQTTLAWFCLGYALRQTGKRAEAASAFLQYIERCRGKKCRMLGIARRYAKQR